MAAALEDGHLVVVDGRPAHRLRRQPLRRRHRRRLPGRPDRAARRRDRLRLTDARRRPHAAMACRALATCIVACTRRAALVRRSTAARASTDQLGSTVAADDTADRARPTGHRPTHRHRRRFEWTEFGDDGRVQTGSLEVPIDYDDPSTGHLRPVRRPPPGRPGQAHRQPAGEPRRPRLRRQRLRDLRRPDLRPTASSSTSTSSAGTRAAPASPSPPSTASTTTTTTTPASTSRPTTPPSERQIADRPGRGVRRRLRRRRTPTSSPYVGTNNSARDMDSIRAGARRGHHQLLRVQLRQRAGRHLGDAVPRHRARRRARRRRRPHRRLRRVRPAAERRLRAGRSPRSSPSAATTPTASSTTTATPRARSTR